MEESCSIKFINWPLTDYFPFSKTERAEKAGPQIKVGNFMSDASYHIVIWHLT